MWRIFTFKIQNDSGWREEKNLKKTSSAGVGSHKHSVCGSKAAQILQYL